ncbi:hypothetical protein PDESU_05896 [Pontiella desulfatans]|uniref:Response regulatory domain-containing protein n=1 Tax=Pontiella desulfatans TaxID=2750659 RepID=A0A6C2UB33_PONDE|nr:response regulator transcription factor [Pontiella desulfatans]VGO17300.1 hypothetical protein PDESU_05896 [Pontiella desulfatans]
MKTIHVAQLGTPGRQWKAWEDALSEAEFDVRSVDPLAMERLTGCTRPGDTVLFDGLLPNLSRHIRHTCARCPEVNIIVATEVDSFAIRYEVMHLNGAIYVSGPTSPDRFVERVRSMIQRECFSDAV